jgi:hypothetical protein
MDGLEQVFVCDGNVEASIDEGIAPLIRELCLADIKTRKSCQEVRPGFAWIQFRTLDDATEFVDIVRDDRDGTDTLSERIGRQSDADEQTRALFWEYGLHPVESQELLQEDDSDMERCNRCGGPICAFLLLPSIIFPVRDIPVLLERMRRHNRERVDRARTLGETQALVDEIVARLVGAKKRFTDARLMDQLDAHREDLLDILSDVEVPLLAEVRKVIEDPDRLSNTIS